MSPSPVPVAPSTQHHIVAATYLHLTACYYAGSAGVDASNSSFDDTQLAPALNAVIAGGMAAATALKAFVEAFDSARGTFSGASVDAHSWAAAVHAIVCVASCAAVAHEVELGSQWCGVKRERFSIVSC